LRTDVDDDYDGDDEHVAADRQQRHAHDADDHDADDHHHDEPVSDGQQGAGA
jgi:hypothetical protein